MWIEAILRTDYKYIDAVLSIHNSFFHSYVNSLYQSECAIKNTTDAESYVSYLCIYLKNVMVLICRSPVFSCLCSSIPSSPAYCVFASQLIGYASTCSTYKQFLKQGKLQTNMLIKQDFQQSFELLTCSLEYVNSVKCSN